jgi:RNA polymerase sigma-70 factor (ECF subfamily)
MELTLSPDPAPGDALTVADLFEEFADPLHRYALRLARDADRADDLVQETLIRAMPHLLLLGQMHPYQRRAWMYRVLKNRFLDEERARKREQDLAQRVAQRSQLVQDPTLMVLSPDLFDQLPEHYGEVLQQHYLLGMTSEEIGHRLGIPAATVRSRLHLAIKWLRAHQTELF